MAFTLAQVQALEAAIAEGALRVKYADKEVEYHSLEEMLIALNKMKQELGLINGNRRRKYAYFNKGLHGCN